MEYKFQQAKQKQCFFFKGRDPVRIKIAINNNIIEQINIFIYPGCSVPYQQQKDITFKISQFLHMTGIINRTL